MYIFILNSTEGEYKYVKRIIKYCNNVLHNYSIVHLWMEALSFYYYYSIVKWLFTFQSSTWWPDSFLLISSYFTPSLHCCLTNLRVTCPDACTSALVAFLLVSCNKRPHTVLYTQALYTEEGLLPRKLFSAEACSLKQYVIGADAGFGGGRAQIRSPAAKWHSRRTHNGQCVTGSQRQCFSYSTVSVAWQAAITADWSILVSFQQFGPALE